MDAATLLIAVLGAFSIVSSIAVLLTKDNFYAALYMSVTMVSIAGIYAVFNLQPVVVMMVLIFVGAVGIVTVAVAATYRHRVSREVSILWTLPVMVVFAVVALSYYLSLTGSIAIKNPGDFTSVVTSEKYSENVFVIFFLISVTVLMMLSAIKLAWRGES